jgi:hypothetical protein
MNLEKRSKHPLSLWKDTPRRKEARERNFGLAKLKSAQYMCSSVRQLPFRLGSNPEETRRVRELLSEAESIIQQAISVYSC